LALIIYGAKSIIRGIKRKRSKKLNRDNLVTLTTRS
jgi:hypothetical protein